MENTKLLVWTIFKIVQNFVTQKNAQFFTAQIVKKYEKDKKRENVKITQKSWSIFVAF